MTWILAATFGTLVFVGGGIAIWFATAPDTAIVRTATSQESAVSTTGDGPASATVLGTIGVVARASGRYQKILGLLETAGLGEDLAGQGPFTLLATSDVSLTDADIRALSTDPKLRTRLLAHVIPGALSSDALTDGQRLTTLAGNTVRVGVRGGTVTFDGVAVTMPDIKASNGLIQGLSGLLPAPKVSTGAGLAAGVPGDYGPWLVLASRDRVFNRLKPKVAAHASKLNTFQGGWGIRIVE